MARSDITEGEVVENRELAVVPESTIGSSLSVSELKKAVSNEIKKRSIIVDFVKSQLVEGTDYGKIHINKNCTNKYNPAACKIGSHFSKDTLYKPGMEKILSLMSLQSSLVRDDETIEMLTKTGYNVPTVAYKCVLTRGGVVLAEGRGAADVGGNNRDVNSTIKIAEKRARMDATLSLGFSEFFTQDLEDMPVDDSPKVPANVDQETGEIKSDPATQKQRNFADKLLRERGAKTLGDVAAIIKLVGVNTDSLDKLDKAGAKKLIDYLLKYEAGQITENLKKDIVITDLPEGDPLVGFDQAALKAGVDINPALAQEMREKFKSKQITGQSAILFTQSILNKPNPQTNDDAMRLIEELDKLED